jgi:hypothetical protein
MEMYFMKKNMRLRIVLLIAVAFLSGGVVGFFSGQLIPPCFRPHKPGPPPSPARVKNMIKHRVFDRLNLSDEQRLKAMPYVDRWYEKMESLRLRHAPEYKAVFGEFFDSLKSILTEEQKQELKEIRTEIENRRPPRGRRGRCDRKESCPEPREEK